VDALTLAEEAAMYRSMRKMFADQGIKFGVALSPVGLCDNPDISRRTALIDKIKVLTDLGIDYLGLFFDDMKASPDMCHRQVELAHMVEASTTAKIIFCPNYYSNDPLLDLLFGKRPEDYLESLGRSLSQNIDILWTGDLIHFSRNHSRFTCGAWKAY